MSKFISTVAVLAAIGCAGVANAADVYEAGSFKDTPVYEPTTWAGFYFGGNLGGIWNETSRELTLSNNQNSVTLSDVEEDDDAEFIGGVHAGYNWQFAQKVFGIEGDVGFSDGFDYLASIRGRLGFAFDSVLVYATGGVAFVGLEEDAVSDFFDLDDTETGFVVGGGIEKKLGNNFSIGVEGLYYQFDDRETDGVITNGRNSVDAEFSEELEFVVVRGRLTYHMTPGYAEPLK